MCNIWLWITKVLHLFHMSMHHNVYHTLVAWNRPHIFVGETKKNTPLPIGYAWGTYMTL